MTLCAKVVDLTGLHLRDDTGEFAAGGEAAVVQLELASRLVRVYVQVSYPLGV